jgi:hypothetical protein
MILPNGIFDQDRARKHPPFSSGTGRRQNGREASLCTIVQYDPDGLDTTVHNREEPQAPWKFESLWPRRSWIEAQRAAEPFGFWLVRVAKHTDIRLFALKKSSPVLREPPAFVQNMTNGDAAACQFDYGLGRIRSVRHRRRCL